MATAQIDSQIWSDLHSLGLNDTAAAGVMGNMAQESGVNPTTPGGGLMQWIGSRWSALVSYANSKGLSPQSESAQVGYFGQELKSGNEGITLQGLNSQTSPAEAALYVSQKYERPDPTAANNANREKQATNFYNQFTGSSLTPSSIDMSGITNTSSSGSSSSSGQGAAAFPTGGDIIGQIDSSMKLNSFNVLQPGKSLAQDAGAIALRTIFIILGLILIIFALVAVVEKVAPGTPPPVPVPV